MQQKENAMRHYAIPALLGLGVAIAAASAQAGESLPQDIARRLDKAPAAFSMSDAKRERLMIIEENMARQRYYDRNHGYGRYGYGGAYGRGPQMDLAPPASGPVPRGSQADLYQRGYYGRW